MAISFYEKAVFWEKKALDQRLGANSKTHFFAQFFSKFATFCIFSAFLSKNAENYYFDQCLNAGQNIQQE